MSGNLMDTNVIVRVLNGDRDLVSKLSQMEGLCSCTVVLGELLYGAEKSQRSGQNKQNAKAFCSRYPLIDITDSVAEVYGYIKKELQSHGNIMPENDMWIAAAAIANDKAVITQDKHFDNIPNLNVIKM